MNTELVYDINHMYVYQKEILNILSTLLLSLEIRFSFSRCQREWEPRRQHSPSPLLCPLVVKWEGLEPQLARPVVRWSARQTVPSWVKSHRRNISKKVRETGSTLLLDRLSYMVTRPYILYGYSTLLIYMGRVSDSVSVCLCFQWFLSDNRSPLLVDPSSSNLVER